MQKERIKAITIAQKTILKLVTFTYFVRSSSLNFSTNYCIIKLSQRNEVRLPENFRKHNQTLTAFLYHQHILNHCIDDIEELVYRVKQVAEMWKQLEAKYKGKKSKSRKQEGL